MIYRGIMSFNLSADQMIFRMAMAKPRRSKVDPSLPSSPSLDSTFSFIPQLRSTFKSPFYLQPTLWPWLKHIPTHARLALCTQLSIPHTTSIYTHTHTHTHTHHQE